MAETSMHTLETKTNNTCTPQETGRHDETSFGTENLNDTLHEVGSRAVQTRTPQGPDMQHSIPCGLVNLGNTCYMNAALQCLGSVVPLKNYFQENCDTFSKEGIVKELATMTQSMWKESKSFNPSKIKSEIKCSNARFGGYTQEDSQEFLLAVLERLHQCLKHDHDIPVQVDPTKHNHDIPGLVDPTKHDHDIPGLVDPTKHDHDIPGLVNPTKHDHDIGLVDPTKHNHDIPGLVDPTKHDHDIPGLVDPTREESTAEWHRYLNRHGESIVSELFEGQHQSAMTCGECNQVTLKFDPQMFLSVPITSTSDDKHPSLLEDCLKNMFKSQHFGGREWHCSKCGKMADMDRRSSISRLPTILMVYLKRFQIGSVSGDRKKVDTLVKFDLSEFDLSNFMSESAIPSPKYKLFAVINHYGSIDGGHYTAYGNRSGKWFDFNDASVHNISEEEIVTGAAYLLFYQKDETKSQPPHKASTDTDSAQPPQNNGDIAAISSLKPQDSSNSNVEATEIEKHHYCFMCLFCCCFKRS